MKTNTFKCFGLIILWICCISIPSFGQSAESVSVKFGGYLQSEDVVSTIPSQAWNTVIKGNSTALLDNSGNLTSCFIRSNAAVTLQNQVDELLLKNSLVLKSSEFITILNIPYKTYDVYVYVCTKSTIETTVKFTINNQSKYIKLAQNAWDGQLDESLAEIQKSAQTGNDYVVFKGLSGNEFTLWADSKENVGPAAIQIVKSASSNEEATAIKAVKESSVNAFIYPNPVKNDLYVEFLNDYTGKLTIQVVDIQGKKVTSFNRVKSEKTFIEKMNIERLKSGKYFIIVIYNGKRVSLPLVKY